jgi:hypothetical protein
MKSSETLTVTSTTASLTRGLYVQQRERANRALIAVADAAVLYTCDGTIPKIPVEDGSYIELLSFNDIQLFRVKSQSGTATLTVDYGS